MDKRNDYNSLAKQPVQLLTTRLEVIDHTTSGNKVGRILTKYAPNIEIQFQDDGRTLKVFLTDKIEK
jgi:hypothetical protein